MVLGSTQPLTEMSTRNIFWGVRTAGTYSWQTCQLHVPISLKSGSFNLLEPSEPPQGLLYLVSYPFYLALFPLNLLILTQVSFCTHLSTVLHPALQSVTFCARYSMLFTISLSVKSPIYRLILWSSLNTCISVSTVTSVLQVTWTQLDRTLPRPVIMSVCLAQRFFEVNCKQSANLFQVCCLHFLFAIKKFKN